MVACKHIYYVYRGRRLAACDCICGACHNGMDCICTVCSHDPEVHISPNYHNDNLKADRLKLGLPLHVCRECGTEVFRKGNVGRYPVKCPDCKEKK